MLRRLVPLGVLSVGTFLFHRYSILTGLDVVQADTGDSRFVTAILEHWNNVVHGAAAWRSVPIFWPAKDTLSYSDAMLGMGVIHAALRTVLDVFAAVNAQLILLTVMTFAACYALMSRGLGRSVWGASLGAGFVAFCWPRFAALPHMQLQFMAPLPLVFLFVLEVVRDGLSLSRGGVAWRLVAAAALLALLLATAPYLAMFAAITLSIGVGLCVLYGPSRRQAVAVVRRQWPGLLVAAAVGVALSGPVVRFYLPVMRRSGTRSWPEVAAALPHPGHLLWMGRENWVWGWLFARWPDAVIDALWPERRIGVGLVASVAWVAGVVWAVTRLRRPMDRWIGPLVLVILVGVVLQGLMLDFAGDHSAWWLVWTYFPGANGLRAIARLELVVTLAMGAWFGFVLDRAVASPWRWARPVAALLVLACAVEQFGAATTFGGRKMAAFERGIAAQLSAPCPAIYVVAPADLLPAVPPVTAATFDAAAYLAANPDVAASWPGSAWAHYQQFGRAEGRVLDAARARAQGYLLALGYNDTLPLAAVLARKPVVNGYSGSAPVGWRLSNEFAPEDAGFLAQWLSRNGRAAGSVCVVPIRITLDMLPFQPPGLWP